MIMDSIFCLLRDFIGMFERVVYGSALENKCILYRSTGIYGDGINAYFYQNSYAQLPISKLEGR